MTEHMDAESFEPILDQFRASRWSIPDDFAQTEYGAAVDELRSSMKNAGVLEPHARLLAQPDPAEVRSLIRTVGEALR